MQEVYCKTRTVPRSRVGCWLVVGVAGHRNKSNGGGLLAKFAPARSGRCHHPARTLRLWLQLLSSDSHRFPYLLSLSHIPSHLFSLGEASKVKGDAYNWGKHGAKDEDRRYSPPFHSD